MCLSGHDTVQTLWCTISNGNGRCIATRSVPRGFPLSQADPGSRARTGPLLDEVLAGVGFPKPTYRLRGDRAFLLRSPKPDGVASPCARRA